MGGIFYLPLLPSVHALEIVRDGFGPGIQFAPACRCGEAPLQLDVEVNMNGRAPFVLTFTWGDTNTDQVITSLNTVIQSHTYSTVGNFTLALRIEDGADIRLDFSWPVSTYSSGDLGVTNYTVFVESFPTPANVSAPFQIHADQPPEWTVWVHNTGSSVITSLEAVYFSNFGGNLCFDPSFGRSKSLGTIGPVFPGSYGFFQVDLPPPPGSGPSTTLQDCVSVFSPSQASPLFNETEFFASRVVATVDAGLVLPTLNMFWTPGTQTGSIGIPSVFTLNLQNTGPRTILMSDIDTGFTPPVSGGLSVIPFDPARFGVWNTTYFMDQGGPGGFCPAADLQQQCILIPVNTTLTMDVSVVSELPGIRTFSVDAVPTVFNPLTGNGTSGPFVSASASLIIEEGLGSIISTLEANVLTTTTVELSGKVISLGGSAFIDTWFQVRQGSEVNFTKVPEAEIRVSVSGTVVRQTIQVEADQNFIFEFVGQTGAGELVYGGVVSFSTDVPSARQQNFGGVLEAMAQLTGFSREVMGLILGLMVLLGAVALMNLGIGRFQDIPVWIQALVFLAIVILNVFLFLWHVGILVVLAIFAGILVVREVRTGGLRLGS